jgi:type IV pilus assembly protein PilE
MKKRGFTLIELIIVVIAIGILATVAVPQYLKAVERAKSAKAKHALGLVAQAEKMYRAEHDDYFAVVSGTPINVSPGIGDFVELDDVAADCANGTGGWCVTVGDTTTTTFTATATRMGGSSPTTITLNQAGEWDGTRPAELGGTPAAS